MTENFNFEIDEDTEVFESCSAMINGNMYIFGGHRNKEEGYKRNQVRIGLDSRSLVLNRFFFQDLKSEKPQLSFETNGKSEL